MIPRCTFVALIFSCCCHLLFAGEFSLLGTTNKEVAIYEPGEEIVFTVKVLEDGEAVGGKKLQWTLSKDHGDTQTGEGLYGEEGLVLTTQMDQPGFVRLKVLAFEEDGSKIMGFAGGWGPDKTGHIFFEGGACVEPGALSPLEEPADFDDYWKGMKAKLALVPVVAVRKQIDSPDPKVNLFEVHVDCAGSRPVTGFLSVPADAEEKSLPAICQFEGYGVRKQTPPGWVHPGAIVFHVNAHGMELNQGEDYMKVLKEELSGYAFDKEENAKPETAYFHDMSLRVMRALEYVKSLPEWNGKELASNGGSQGGLQGLWGAGLDPDVTSGNIWSPWCCDIGGDELGRIEGWQPDYTGALAYYDPVYHVRHTRAKIHLIANLGDYVCPPSGVWVVYNQIPHENKSMEVKQGCTHSFAMNPHMSFTVTPEGIQKVGFKDRK